MGKKGLYKTEKRQSGLLIQYAYDNLDRLVSETRSGPGMMTETMTYDYTPVDASDPVLPVDTRPRTIVKTLDNIECERTYYVYAPLTNIVERVGTQGRPLAAPMHSNPARLSPARRRATQRLPVLLR